MSHAPANSSNHPQVGQVSELWRYPVKSMMGRRHPELEFEELGAVGDRGWATRDENAGAIRGAKKIGGLMGLSARYAEEPTSSDPTPVVVLTDADGLSVRSDDPSCDDWLTARLDRPVSLWPRQPAEDLDHYRRGAPDSEDFLQELRDIFGRETDEPLPDLGVFPPEILTYESPLGTYVDAFPVLIVTTSSLEHLSDLAPESQIDVRRFRPNIVVDTGDAEGFVEQEWVGQTVDIGGVTLEVVTGCPRCVMITRGFADLPQDRALMRTVVGQADQNLGVYATVSRPGTIHTGAGVALR